MAMESWISVMKRLDHFPQLTRLLNPNKRKTSPFSRCSHWHYTNLDVNPKSSKLKAPLISILWVKSSLLPMIHTFGPTRSWVSFKFRTSIIKKRKMQWKLKDSWSIARRSSWRKSFNKWFTSSRKWLLIYLICPTWFSPWLFSTLRPRSNSNLN